MPINSYKDLIVWQKSKQLAVLIYSLTSEFPKDEQYSLVSQIRRSAISIIANIAEGRGRGTRKDFTNFLHIALGSCLELEAELSISKELKFGIIGKYEEIELLNVEVMKMLTVMIQKLKTNS